MYSDIAASRCCQRYTVLASLHTQQWSNRDVSARLLTHKLFWYISKYSQMAMQGIRADAESKACLNLVTYLSEVAASNGELPKGGIVGCSCSVHEAQLHKAISSR